MAEENIADTTGVHAEKLFGCMLTPLYTCKLETIDVDVQHEIAQAAQRDRYHKESQSTIQVLWWNEVKPKLMFAIVS